MTVLLWQGHVHHFDAPLPAVVDAVLSWLHSALTGDIMPTSKSCERMCALLQFLPT